jgi:hypothetical protein
MAATESAETMYLELPIPREIKALVGRQVPAKRRGRSAKPFTLTVLKRWYSQWNWASRAAVHDRRVAYEIEQRFIAWKVDEAEKRLRQRLQAAELQRVIAMEYLTEDGRPQDLEALDPRRAEIAGQYIKESGHAERLDLGEATERTEEVAKPIEVAAPAALEDLRTMVKRLEPVLAQYTPPSDEEGDSDDDVIDGVFRVTSIS